MARASVERSDSSRQFPMDLSGWKCTCPGPCAFEQHSKAAEQLLSSTNNSRRLSDRPTRHADRLEHHSRPRRSHSHDRHHHSRHSHHDRDRHHRRRRSLSSSPGAPLSHHAAAAPGGAHHLTYSPLRSPAAAAPLLTHSLNGVPLRTAAPYTLSGGGFANLPPVHAASVLPHSAAAAAAAAAPLHLRSVESSPLRHPLPAQAAPYAVPISAAPIAHSASIPSGAAAAAPSASELYVSKTELDKAELEVQKAQASAHRARTDAENEIARARKDAKRRTAAAEDAAEKARQKSAASQAQIDSYEADIKQLQQQVDDLAQRLTVKNEENEALQSQIDNFRRLLDERHKQWATAENDLRAAHAADAEYKVKVVEMTRQIESLTQAVQQAQQRDSAENNDLAQRVRDQLAETDAVRAQLTKAMKINELLTNKIDLKDKSLLKYYKKIAQFESEIRRTSGSSKELQDALAESRQLYEEERRRADTLHYQLQTLRIQTELPPPQALDSHNNFQATMNSLQSSGGRRSSRRDSFHEKLHQFQMHGTFPSPTRNANGSPPRLPYSPNL